VRAAPRGAAASDQLEGVSPGWLAVLLFIATEVALFGSLLSSYFYLRSAEAEWPPAGIPDPHLGLVSIGTVLLLASSVPVAWAEGGIRRGDVRRLRLGLLVASLLGLAFLGVQANEYRNSEFGLSSGVYGSLFFTITGLHGLHLIVGLLMLAVAQGWAALGYFSERSYAPLRVIVVYWHFVDVVWIFVFASLYLAPRFG